MFTLQRLLKKENGHCMYVSNRKK